MNMTVPSFLGPVVPLTLTPSPAVAGASATGAPAGGAAPNALAFQMEPQQQTEWCWAATAASVATFYAKREVQTQCQIASACLNDLPCCSAPLPTGCNTTHALEPALEVIGHYVSDAQQTPFQPTALENELNEQHPVCCHIQWTDGSGHFNAIYGYDPSVGDVDVGDPYYGDQTIPYTTLADDYHSGGNWDYYYLTH
ncbi:hypothetical protein M3A49_21715 [Paraburkholderia sp. CNPSo 3076]|uniref:papain-like cysteine protease family protein n=1 Tax=Paraburkholderia sp. CNPSo 3076 TaxID=2940936 RepID=UPI002254E14C|nr:papain-like cysteine protease family protein [Paraburkholderia sp. CNPSo 3076]MCX5542095.1 hypothetical protein [Paraburkholderia sp. CNPSo 3076]